MPEGTRGVKVVDLRDREFLLVLNDVISDHEEGWASSWDMAERLGAPHRNVAQRLSHMVRFGLTEREVQRDEHGNIRYRRSGVPMYAQRWRLTQSGERLAFGKLTAQQQRLADLPDERMVMIAELVGRRYTSDPTLGALLRREWSYATARERRVNGTGS
jgi:hypothetical protein